MESQQEPIHDKVSEPTTPPSPREKELQSRYGLTPEESKYLTDATDKEISKQFGLTDEEEQDMLFHRWARWEPWVFRSFWVVALLIVFFEMGKAVRCEVTEVQTSEDTNRAAQQATKQSDGQSKQSDGQSKQSDAQSKDAENCDPFFIKVLSFVEDPKKHPGLKKHHGLYAFVTLSLPIVWSLFRLSMRQYHRYRCALQSQIRGRFEKLEAAAAAEEKKAAAANKSADGAKKQPEEKTSGSITSRLESVEKTLDEQRETDSKVLATQNQLILSLATLSDSVAEITRRRKGEAKGER